MSPSKVVVFGSINLDMIFTMEALPAPGQTRLANRLSLQPGGKGANQAVAARRDGAAVYMVGAVGEDVFAATALAIMAESDVDLSALRRIPGAHTGCASIGTDPQGRNQISVALGANTQLMAEDLPPALLQPGAVLLLQMEADPAQVAAVMERAQAAGTRTVLNLAPMRALPKPVLQRAAIIVVNEDEAEALACSLGCAATATALHASLGVTIIRTMGSAGAEAAGAEGLLQSPAPRIEAVDTTAAGDCFVGTLAAALCRQRPLAEALNRACVAASIACMTLGSQRSLPWSDEIDAQMRHLPQ